MDSLLLKDKAGCFPNWHEVQSKLSLDIEPNRPLEANVVPEKMMHDQDENAKVQEMVRKKLQQQQKQEQQVEDEDCPQETYAEL